jgi:hypothetical protein
MGSCNERDSSIKVECRQDGAEVGVLFLKGLERVSITSLYTTPKLLSFIRLWALLRGIESHAFGGVPLLPTKVGIQSDPYFFGA